MNISSVSAGSSALPASSSDGLGSYLVQRGDTLYDIAKRHGIALSELIAANPQIVNPDLIYPDQSIHLPAGAGGQQAGGRPADGQQGGPASAGGAAPVAPGAPTGDPGAGIGPEQLQQIVPTIDAAKAAEVAPHLNHAMAEAGIDTPQRQAMFIAQLAHESGGFQYLEEIASGEAYEGRSDLGNTEPGDGARYKGRGYIQLTGRANYRAAGEALGLDLEGHPELAALPENAARVAAWYWNSRDINAAADSGDFVQVTRLINGGTNGLADREEYYARARAALGI